MIRKILIEINRLKNELDGYSAKEGLDYIESYINTLSKQQVKEPDKSLEEAARLYADDQIPTDYPDYFCRQDIKDAFIAGAEWQAKQGYSLEYVIQYAWGVSDTSTESKKATLSFPLPADIFEGDRVIVQIRKK